MAAIGSVEACHEVEGGAVLLAPGTRVEVRFARPDVLRIGLSAGSDPPGRSLVLREGAPSAFASARVTIRPREVVVDSGPFAAHVGRQPLSLRVQDREGHVLFAVPAGEFEVGEGWIVARLELSEQERIYGLGQAPRPGRLDLRGQGRDVWHEWRAFSQSGPAAIPFFVSTRGYGLLLASSDPSRFAFGEPEPPPSPDPPGSERRAPAPWPLDHRVPGARADRITVMVRSTQVEMYVILGRSLAGMLEGYRDLTGAAPVPPLWALGFIQSKNRYRTQRELLEVARQYRARGLPGDVLVIDWLWFKAFGDLEWDREAWPDPPALCRDLAGMGFRVMQAQHPFVDRGSVNWQPFLERGWLIPFPGVEPPHDPLVHDGLIDLSHPEAQRAWWELVERRFQDGVRAYWIDMGEPEQHPPGVRHFLGEREQVHNVYSLLWAKTLFEGQRARSPERVFMLARTTYAGIQRYGCAMWSGDVSPTWEVLRTQVLIAQQVALSGQPYWTTDIGGFMPVVRYDPELYVRWLQWGAWCPLFRTHGTRPGNEPWSFGPAVEPLIRQTLELRYRLLPYIYAHAWQTHLTGLPVMRPMVLEYTGDPRACQREDQFLFGDALLVAPVLYQGMRERSVYLPAGKWYDFWSDRPVQGPAEIVTFAPLARIPLFVKAGAILPWAPEALHTRDAQWDPLTLHVYPGADGRFVLREDDGTTYAYERGERAETVVEFHDAARTLWIGPTEGRFRGQYDARSVVVVFHDVEPPEAVWVDDGPVPERPAGLPEPATEAGYVYEGDRRRLTVWLGRRSVRRAIRVRLVGTRLPTTRHGQRDAAVGQGAGRLRLDASWPEPGVAVVFAYLEDEPASEAVDLNWRILPAPGWVSEPVALNLQAGPVAARAWRCRAVGPSFAQGSVTAVELTVRRPDGTSSRQAAQIALGSEYVPVWSLLGPLRLTPGQSLSNLESRLVTGGDLAAACAGDAGLPWRRLTLVDDCFGYVNLAQSLLEGDAWPQSAQPWSAYAVTRVWAPAALEARLELLGEDELVAWLDGEALFAEPASPSVEPARARVSLREGWNTLVVRCSKRPAFEPGGRSWGFYARLVDEQGRSLKDLRFAAPY